MKSLIATLLWVTFLLGCGGSSSTGGGPTPNAQLNGSWHATLASAASGGGSTLDVFIVQRGATLASDRIALGGHMLVRRHYERLGQPREGQWQLALSPEACQGAPAAIRLLNRGKFDAVVVDLQLGDHSGLILAEVRVSTSSRTAVTFAIGGGDAEATAAFRKSLGLSSMGLFSTQSIRTTLKPAMRIDAERTTTLFQYPISIPVFICRRTVPEVRCYSVNISEGGMAVSTFAPLSPGEEVQVQFTLPDRKVPLLAESRICRWKTGHLGARSVSLSQERKSELQDWLSRKLEEILPGFVAGTFQKAEGCSIPTLGG
jgi:PilZ domain